MSMHEDRQRALLRRGMPTATAQLIDQWLAVEPRDWAVRHGPSLHAAGLSPQDATDLYRRLGSSVAGALSNLIDAGRMADIDIRHIHWWAASGLLRVEVTSTGRRGRAPKFTHWVTQARRYIVACGGDQRLAALAAAAGLSVEEAVAMRGAGELDAGALEILAAFREGENESAR